MKFQVSLFFLLAWLATPSTAQSLKGYFNNEDNRAELVITDVPVSKLDAIYREAISTNDSLGVFFYLCGKAKSVRYEQIDSAFWLINQARAYIPNNQADELSMYLYYVQGLLFIEINSIQDAYLLFYKVLNSTSSTQHLRFEALTQLFTNNIQLQGLGNQMTRGELLIKQEELFNEYMDTGGAFYPHMKYQILTSKAILATLKGENEQSLRYFKESLEQALLMDNDSKYYNAMGNIGYAFSQLQQYDSAIFYLRKDYKYSYETNKALSLSGILTTLVDIYAAIKNEDSAYFYMMKNDSIIRASRKYAWVKRHYQQLASYYEQKNDLKNLMTVKDNYIAIIDTINQLSEANLMRYAESKTQLEKTEGELVALAELHALNEQMLKTNMKFTAIFALLATLVIVSYIFLYKSMNEKKEINKKLLEQKEEIASQNEKLLLQHNHIQKQYETIKEMNVLLEKDAELKGETINLQNQKITNYAHFNSHKLRAPIARLLGLAYLLRNDYLNDANEHQSFIEKIDHCVQELDEEVKKFSRELE